MFSSPSNHMRETAQLDYITERLLPSPFLLLQHLAPPLALRMVVAAASTIAVAPAELGEALAAIRLCAPEAQQEMQLSLAKLGQLTPVQVYRAGGGLELFDGFKRVRAARQLSWSAVRAEVHVVLGTTADDFFAIGARLDISLPALSDDEGNRLIEAAHQRCPYSRALSSSIETEVRLVASA